VDELLKFYSLKTVFVTTQEPITPLISSGELSDEEMQEKSEDI